MTSPIAVNSLSYVDHVIDRNIDQYKPTLPETDIKTKCNLNQDHKDYQKKIKKCCEKEIPLECLAVYYMKSSSDYNYNELSHYMKALLKSQSHSRDIKVYILRILYVLRFFPEQAASLCTLISKYTNYDGQYELKNLWKKTQFDKHVFNAIFVSLVRMPLETFNKLVTQLQELEKKLHTNPTSARKKPPNAADVVYICIPKLRAKHKDDFMWWVHEAQELEMKWDASKISWFISRNDVKVPEILLMFRQQMMVTMTKKDIERLNESKEEWKNTNMCATFSAPLPKHQNAKFNNKKIKSDHCHSKKYRWRRFWGLDRSVWYPQTADGRKAPWCMTGTRESITISKIVKKQHVRYEKFHDEDKIEKVFKIQHHHQIKWIYITKHTGYKTFLWYVAKTMKLVETSEDARYLLKHRQLMFTWNLETMELEHDKNAITFETWGTLPPKSTINIKLSTIDQASDFEAAAVIEKPHFLPMLWRRHWNMYHKKLSAIEKTTYNYAKLYVVLHDFSTNMSQPNSDQLLDKAHFLRKGLLNPNHISQNEIKEKLQKTTNDQNDHQQINNEISALYSLTDNIRSQSEILNQYKTDKKYEQPEQQSYKQQIEELKSKNFKVIHTPALGDCLYHAVIEVMVKLNIVPYHHQLKCYKPSDTRVTTSVYMGSSKEKQETELYVGAMTELRKNLSKWVKAHTHQKNKEYFEGLNLEKQWDHLLKIGNEGTKGGLIELAVMSYMFGINIHNIILSGNKITSRVTITPHNIDHYFKNIPKLPYRKYIPTIHLGFLSSNHYVGLYYENKYINVKHKEGVTMVQNHIQNNNSLYLLVDGYAGTGKTKLALDVCRQYQGGVTNAVIFVMGPTNSVVVNLQERYKKHPFLLNAHFMTVHKFIYSQMYIEKKTGLFKGTVRSRKQFKTDFKISDSSKLVIIIDEAYILNQQIVQDLKKILCYFNNRKHLVMMMGDRYQLSINKNKKFDVFSDIQAYRSNAHRLTLQHVYRQASNSIINKIATVTRTLNGLIVLPLRTFNQQHQANEFSVYHNQIKFVKACAQQNQSILLCRHNTQRVQYNKRIRSEKYGDQLIPLHKDEPLIILNNVYTENKKIDFHNSQLVKFDCTHNNSFPQLKNKKFQDDHTLKYYHFGSSNKFKITLHDTSKRVLEEVILLKNFTKSENTDFFELDKSTNKTVFLTYAHAMTVFRAQGLQWKSVFVDIAKMNAQEYYTAITRSQCEVGVYKQPSKQNVTVLTEKMLTDHYENQLTPIAPKFQATKKITEGSMLHEISKDRGRLMEGVGILFEENICKDNNTQKYTFNQQFITNYDVIQNIQVQAMVSNQPTYAILVV